MLEFSVSKRNIIFDWVGSLFVLKQIGNMSKLEKKKERKMNETLRS